MLEALPYILMGVGAWTVLSSVMLYFRDRSGNSGRSTHVFDNERLDGPDDAGVRWRNDDGGLRG